MFFSFSRMTYISSMGPTAQQLKCYSASKLRLNLLPRSLCASDDYMNVKH